MRKLTIVVPMYNEEEMIPLFFEEINKVIDQITSFNTSILCVNDGSKDGTLNALKKQREIQKNIHIVSFSRNFGHEAAVAAGLNHADGDAVIVMDADLQDPPSLILEMIKKFDEGYDVVNAKRVNRKKDPFLKRVTAEMFYKVIGKLSGKIKVPNNVGNYRLMSKRVVKLINELSEKNHVFRVQVPYVGFKTTEVEFVRPERPKGETHYNYKSMFKLAGDSITSSSITPLRWPFKWGIILAIITILIAVINVILYFNSVIGNNGLNLTIIGGVISFATSLILISIGLIGEYIGRVLIESQNRPLYYVDEELKEMK